MALQTLPTYALSVGSGPSEKQDVLEKKLGDGFMQVAANGINALVMTYRLNYKGIAKTEAIALRDFMRLHKGVVPFYFTIEGEVTARKWRCKSWTGPTFAGGDLRNFEATLVEDFSL